MEGTSNCQSMDSHFAALFIDSSLSPYSAIQAKNTPLGRAPKAPMGSETDTFVTRARQWPVRNFRCGLGPGPSLESEDGEFNETPTQRRDRLVRTFGNLTLLTQKLNLSVSNAPFREKRSKITHQKALRLNVYFQDCKIWDEEAILRRGRSLFKAARAIWPRP